MAVSSSVVALSTTSAGPAAIGTPPPPAPCQRCPYLEDDVATLQRRLDLALEQVELLEKQAVDLRFSRDCARADAQMHQGFVKKGWEAATQLEKDRDEVTELNVKLMRERDEHWAKLQDINRMVERGRLVAFPPSRLTSEEPEDVEGATNAEAGPSDKMEVERSEVSSQLSSHSAQASPEPVSTQMEQRTLPPPKAPQNGFWSSSFIGKFTRYLPGLARATQSAPQTAPVPRVSEKPTTHTSKDVTDPESPESPSTRNTISTGSRLRAQPLGQDRPFPINFGPPRPVTRPVRRIARKRDRPNFAAEEAERKRARQAQLDAKRKAHEDDIIRHEEALEAEEARKEEERREADMARRVLADAIENKRINIGSSEPAANIGQKRKRVVPIDKLKSVPAGPQPGTFGVYYDLPGYHSGEDSDDEDMIEVDTDASFLTTASKASAERESAENASTGRKSIATTSAESLKRVRIDETPTKITAMRNGANTEVQPKRNASRMDVSPAAARASRRTSLGEVWTNHPEWEKDFILKHFHDDNGWEPGWGPNGRVTIPKSIPSEGKTPGPRGYWQRHSTTAKMDLKGYRQFLNTGKASSEKTFSDKVSQPSPRARSPLKDQSTSNAQQGPPTTPKVTSFAVPDFDSDEEDENVQSEGTGDASPKPTTPRAREQSGDSDQTREKALSRAREQAEKHKPKTPSRLRTYSRVSSTSSTPADAPAEAMSRQPPATSQSSHADVSQAPQPTGSFRDVSPEPPKFTSKNEWNEAWGKWYNRHAKDLHAEKEAKGELPPVNAATPQRVAPGMPELSGDVAKDHVADDLYWFRFVRRETLTPAGQLEWDEEQRRLLAEQANVNTNA